VAAAVAAAAAVAVAAAVATAVAMAVAPAVADVHEFTCHACMRPRQIHEYRIVQLHNLILTALSLATDMEGGHQRV
jgi:ABC-type uncharacterized transport system permease subunit